VKLLQDYYHLTKMQLLALRTAFIIISVVNIGFIAGFVYGFGFLFGDVPDATALYITVGSATNALIVGGLVMLPQFLAQAKEEGRLDYIRSLPVSREAYLLANITVIAGIVLPGIVLALITGGTRYGISFDVSPMVLVVVPLAALSTAGLGVAIAVLSPKMQLTNAITQLFIFYAIFFSPVMMPEDNLPSVLQSTSKLLPPGYAADAMRATLTDLPNTNLNQSLIAMAAFSLLSLAAASTVIRRRG
jgi:ABC-2 type transport system permease protein